MALDEALLERAIEEPICHIRLYRWDAPTVSLGYFQDDSIASIPENLRGLNVVRRLSGGGAILHHHELTYSCSVPPEHPLAKRPTALYEGLHACLIEHLRRRGVESATRGESLDFPQGEPFLCYSRGDQNDVLCRGDKIIGSAQRRRRGAVLQHGSILLKRSEYAPQFPGLEDFYPALGLLEDAGWQEELGHRMGSILGTPRPVGRLSETLQTRAAELDTGKYSFPARRFAPDASDNRD
jgi:lipoyl(octanoyl) transferase